MHYNLALRQIWLGKKPDGIGGTISTRRIGCNYSIQEGRKSCDCVMKKKPLWGGDKEQLLGKGGGTYYEKRAPYLYHAGWRRGTKPERLYGPKQKRRAQGHYGKETQEKQIPTGLTEGQRVNNKHMIIFEEKSL